MERPTRRNLFDDESEEEDNGYRPQAEEPKEEVYVHNAPEVTPVPEEPLPEVNPYEQHNEEEYQP